MNEDVEQAQEALNEMEVPWEKKLEEEKQKNLHLEERRK